MADFPERFNLASQDPLGDRRAALRSLFPDVFREDKVDLEALRRALGDWAEAGPERFGLTWPGKAECMRVIQEPSIGTLVPMREESVDFDTTQNVIIEGENLEVLKLLQKAYYGKVKLIYIDPPYNTGKEFIYPDNFKEGLADYLRYSGQVDAEGFKLTANTETDGRYHSKWLSMMYPRLFLARNLLREDGVVFVSIDDHEVHNLRALMNEIFGEENFCGVFIWEKKKKPSFLNASMGVTTDYIMAFAKHRPTAPAFTNGVVEDGKLFPFNNAGNGVKTLTFPANSVSFGFPDCAIEPQDMSEGNIKTELLDRVEIKNGRNVTPFRLSGEFRYSQATLDEFAADEAEIVIRQKVFRPNYVNRSGAEKKTANLLTIKGTKTPTNEDATQELRDLFGRDVMEYPKPVGLLKFLIASVTVNDDLVLDFFAGSGTTADAAFAQNEEDNGTRRFILVQLPEPMEDGDFPTIADLTRERVRRAAEARSRRQSPLGAGDPDLGFRAYRLSASNFRVWHSENTEPGSVAEQLGLLVDHVVGEPARTTILVELLLKAGYQLTSQVEVLGLGGVDVYSVAEGALLVCLSEALTIEVFEAMVAVEPAMILVLDAGFGGSDELKVNALQTVRARNQRVGSDIVLRVV